MIYSKQREMVLEAVRGTQGQHPTADMLHAVIRTDLPSVSLATVYRNLNQLVDTGQIARVSIPGCADRFDPVTDGHTHLVCTGCGTVVDVPRDALPNISASVQQATGCAVERFDLVFYGRCPQCQQ